MSDREYVDTNALVRLLIRDNPEQADAVAAYVALAPSERARIFVTPATLSEIVFVLRGVVYGFSRQELVSALEAILALPVAVEDRDVVESAVGLYRDHHDNWTDCLVSSYALVRAGGRLLSYDRELRRIPGLERFEPPVAAS